MDTTNGSKIKRSYNIDNNVFYKQLDNLEDLREGTKYMLGKKEENINVLDYISDVNLRDKKILHPVEYVGYKNNMYIFKNLKTNVDEEYYDMDLIDQDVGKPTILEINQELPPDIRAKIFSFNVGGKYKNKKYMTKKKKYTNKTKKKYTTKTKKNKKYMTKKKKSMTKKNKSINKKKKSMNTNKKYITKKNKKNNKKGGVLKSKCSASAENFPKCGKEGCVYLDDENFVTKKQWKTIQEMPSYNLSLEGQNASESQAPIIISTNIKPCNLISKEGSENKAPCFVKRHRHTKSGEKILYEEENRDSWCRNYGVNQQCVVDETMYNNFKNNVHKISVNPNKNIKLPEVDTMLDGDASSIDDEGLGDLHDEIDIDESFTNVNPIFLTDIKMNRVKGITIAELIQEMFEILGPEKTMSVSKEWEDEKDKIIQQVFKIGYTSPDFNEQNIMIDIDSEELCDWIDEHLAQGEVITPEKIKQHFGKEDILKIVDWGLLQRVKKEKEKDK